jgi:hypothetical protein
LVTAYWRTNLTLRRLSPLFGVSKFAADRIIGRLGSLLALRPRGRFGRDTVQEHNELHERVRARVEHAFARMKSWKILRDCRVRGDGVHTP